MELRPGHTAHYNPSMSSARHAPPWRNLTMFKWLVSGLTAAGLAMCLPTAGAQDASEDEEIPFHGPDVHPGYPDAFFVSYTLRKNTVSPDGKYGVIFPDRTR